MNAHLINIWDRFRTSFWFVPILMCVIAVVLAIVTGWIDVRIASYIETFAPWAKTEPSAARSALTTVSSAMITLAGVVFSITVVTVSMASSQYGSRLLRCFMMDSVADVVIGSFVGAGLFCMITVRAVSEPPNAFTPHLSTALGLLMGLMNIGLLIFFIHNVAVSIQASSIVESLSRDLHSAVDRLYPESPDEESDQSVESARETFCVVDRGESQQQASGLEIRSRHEGYIEGIDFETLAAAGKEADSIVRLTCMPGDFVVQQQVLAWLGQDRVLKEDEEKTVVSQILAGFVIGARRTPRQDINCSVLEVVDVALRSLSPGINDPFTAMNCIDRLAGALSVLVRRELPDRRLFDKEGRLRLSAPTLGTSDVIHEAFRPIRQYAASSVDVSMHLVGALTVIARAAVRTDDVRATVQQAEAIRAAFLETEPQDIDRLDFERKFATFEEVAGAKVGGRLQVDRSSEDRMGHAANRS